MVSDQEAWQTVTDNLGLGYKLAGRFYQSRKKFGKNMGSAVHDEMRSAVPEILFKAAKGFDPSKGYKFSTYAGTALWRGFLTIEKYENRRQGVELDDTRVYKDRGLDRAEVLATLDDTSLSDRDKDIIYAYFVQGFEKAEIVEMLDTTMGIVKRVLYKTVGKLDREVDPQDLRPEGGVALSSPRKSRRVHLPHDAAEPEPSEVRVTRGHDTMTGTILDRIREDPAVAAKRKANRDEAEEDAKAMERWYADLRKERE